MPVFARSLSLAFGAALLWCTAASAQPRGSASTLREADARVARVAWRLALAGRDICPASFPATGILFHHLAEYEADDRRLMLAHGLGRGPGILTVLEGSPGAGAGLAAGDVLLSVDGAALPSPLEIAAEPMRKLWRARVEESEKLLEDRLRAGPVRLEILREGRVLAMSLGSVPACLGRVRLARSTQVNAFASGSRVIMTTAMLAYLRSDDELAVVLAHELSHNILGHPDLLDAQGVPKRGILRGIGKNAKRVWRTEAEADRFAIRLVAAAGFDVGAAIPFWRRYYADYDIFPQIFRTHPSLGARERITLEAIAALPAAR